MSGALTTATFQTLEVGRSAVVGTLNFSSVSALLGIGTKAIDAGAAAIIDLRGITESDSSGLALLVEWLSVARNAKRTLRYENMPQQIRQLARLSDVEDLLDAKPEHPDVKAA